MSNAFFLALFLLFGLSALRVPVALATYVGAVAYLFATRQDPGLIVEQGLNGLFDSYLLLAVPLFIMAANFMNAGSVSDRLLTFCLALVGRFRGGLGHVNVIANIIFAGMSGSAVADAAGIGRVIIDMMRKENRYPAGYAAALTAAASVIGPIIPPSIPMVLYALISDTSIGYLFLGGILPGLFIGVVLMAMNAWIATRRNFPRDAAAPLKEMPRITFRAFPALMLPVILLFGIYGGATTPTEAASVAAAYALFLSAIAYRGMSWTDFGHLMLDAAKSTAVVGLIIASALVLNYLVASENIPALMSKKILAIETTPLVFLVSVNVLFLLLGCLFDATTLILIVIPLFLPAARALQIDMVHFGVVMTVNIMIGLVTPPYGVLLFVINGLTGIPLKDIIREVWPFILVLCLSLATMVVWPDVVLFVPRLFGYLG
ncbi:MAG: TRAP transporter large permease [Hyphomicrobiales bacterium]|nr:TRAP transporter large permease [Hyphomicrobiales bacterium]